MRKVLIDKAILTQEMRLAAIKGMQFNYLMRNLRRDYDTTPIENSDILRKLDESYATLSFIATERKVKYGMVG